MQKRDGLVRQLGVIGADERLRQRNLNEGRIGRERDRAL